MKRNYILFRYSKIAFGLGLLAFGLIAVAGSGPTPTALPNPLPSANLYYYGTSVALSPDGSLAVVGANSGGYGIDNPPAVYVFQYAKGAWGTTPLITVCDPAAMGTGCSNDTAPASQFASAVAISGINNGSFMLIVGASGGDVVNGNAVNYGVAYLYQCSLSGTPSCTKMSQITDPATKSTDQFGSAVAISSDGNTVLVGAWGTTEKGGAGVSNSPEPNVGSAYVYTSSSGVWAPTPAVIATLNDPAPTCAIFGTSPNQQTVCDEFSYSVALSGTGSTVTALIGAPGAVESNTGTSKPGEGQAFIFSNSSGTWSPVATFTDPNTVACSDVVYLRCDGFGTSVALSADGSIVLVGAPNAVPGSPSFGEAGVANLYTQSSGSWNSTSGFTFTNPDTKMNSIYTGSYGFGWSLAISNNGGSLTALIGNPEATEGTDNGGYGGTGEVDIYTCAGSPSPSCSNTPESVLVDPALVPTSASPTDYFGAAIALSADNSVMLAGAPDTDSAANGGTRNNGAAYVYGIPSQQATPVLLTMSISGPNNTAVNAGQNLTYALTVTNTDKSESALNVTLTGTLAAGVTLVSDSPGGATCSASGSNYSCILSSLGPGASWTPTVTVQISSADAGQTVVAASASVKADNSSNNPSITASVTVLKTASSILSVGYVPFYTGFASAFGGGIVCSNIPGSGCLMIIVVTNNSQTQPADNVGLVLTIPQGTTISDVNASPGICLGPDGGKLYCGFGTLKPATSWVITFGLYVNSTTQAGQTLSSQATVSAGNTGSESASFDFTVGTPTYVPSSGGIGWLELTALAGILWLVRRRTRRQIRRCHSGKSKAHRLALSEDKGQTQSIEHLFETTRKLFLRAITASIVILPLAGCALSLKPSPPTGSTGLASPVAIGVTSNTEIVNISHNGPATTLPATVNGNPYTLNCNASGSTCTLSQAFPTGAYTLNVTALVTWPAFYSAPTNAPVACNVPGNGSIITQCYTLATTSAFDVGCAAGPLTIVTNMTLIATPAGQAMTPIQLAAQGGCPPYTWTVSNQSGLPPGISISASGLITGTEQTACTPDAWTYDNSITVTDSLNDTVRSVMTFNVCAQ
ncbi:MAG: hypothetical protein WBR15_02550 [Gammaproteobacteria bacterium]